MEKEEIFKRNNGLMFTKIAIKKCGKKRTAYFDFWFDDSKPKVQTSITGVDEGHCIEKVEEFLGYRLDDSEYFFDYNRS